MHTIDTASGRRIDLDAPHPSQIVLDDVAGGLSRVCHFGAQSLHFHSVAEHAVLVSQLVVDGGHPELGLAALHHDSHEAYVCDIPAPLKRKLQDAGDILYEQVCADLNRAIAQRLKIAHLAPADEEVIKAADNKALMIEAAELLHDGGAGIATATGLATESTGQLGESLAPDRARQQFLHVHEALLRLISTR